MNIKIKTIYYSLIIFIAFYSCSCKRSSILPKPSKSDTSASSTSATADSSIPTTVTLTVTFSSPATGASSSIAPLKYNKVKWMSMNFDDAALCVPAINTYFKTKTYTDGCGNNIHYTSGVAVIGSYTYDAYLADTTLINNPSRQGLSYKELPPLVADGWDIENHTQTHSNTNADNSNYSTSDYLKSVTDAQTNILTYSKYKANMGVVPSNFYSYYTAFKTAGLLGGTSQGWSDNMGLPALWDGYNKPKELSQINDYNYFAIQREFAVGGSDGVAWYSQTHSDDWDIWGMASSFINATVNGFELIGTHSFDSSHDNLKNFQSWIDYLRSNLGDNLAFSSTREIIEYLHLRNYVVKAESINGNQLTINIDYRNVPNKNISWYDLSFLISSTASIQNVSCSDKSFYLSYNASSKLINIKKRITIWNR